MAKIALKSKKEEKEPSTEDLRPQAVVEEAAVDTSFMEDQGTKLTKKISISRKEAAPVASAKEEKKEAPIKEEKKAVAAKTKVKPRGKKYLEVAEKVDRGMKYKALEAVELAQQTSYSKFTGAVEVHINTAAKNIRGLASLPFASGKKLTIVAFGKGAEESGADIVGTDEVLEEVMKSKINFDVMVTSPEWMPKLAKAARVLGPRGLMPSPKNGTISNDLAKTVAEIQSGKVEYKTEPNGQVIHMSVGKVDQSAEEIVNNLKALYNVLGKSRVKKMTVAATMGPGVKVDLASL